MAIDGLFERSTVRFVTPLSPEETEAILQDIAKKQSYVLRLVLEQHRTFGNILDIEDYSPDIGSSKITGTYSARDGTSASFSCEIDTNDYRRFGGIRFSTIPGYEVEEHNPREVAIWDAVKAYLEHRLA